jgi:1,4-dihydroxy-2-naphthoate octaprenyltransferase
MAMTEPTPGRASIWWQAIRPRTLAAGAAPVLVGTALAVADGAFHPWAAIFALAGALALQIGTNIHNDYEDYVRGADGPDRVGPKRATAEGWVAPETVRRAAIGVFLAAVVIGVYLVARGGLPILALGLASVAAGYSYTGGPKPLAYVGLGDLFVLLFFGFAAVVGTYYVQALHTCAAAWWLGLGVGLLSTAILAVNNLRDHRSDSAAGKRTLAVRFGTGVARLEYTLCLAVAYLALLPATLAGHPGVLLGLLSLPTARKVHDSVMSREGAALGPCLGATAKLLARYGALISAGLGVEALLRAAWQALFGG